MSSETSAVLVAVRIRPFTKKEDPMTCTVTVSDSTTITIRDVPAAASTLMGLSSSSASASTTGLSGAVTSMGRETIGASGDSALAKLAKEGLVRHSYTFDRIFWSIEPHVLPLPSTKLMSTAQALSGASSASASLFIPTDNAAVDLSASVRSSVSVASGSATGGGGGRAEAKGMQRQQHVMTVAQQLPCFNRAPVYEDQADIYAFIGPRLSQSVMSGFHSCIFAYGQTGSGKSYSMMGPAEKLSANLSSPGAEELGIMPRLAHDIFERMREERIKDESVSFNVEVSFLEIYCEKVRDLLSTCGDGGGAAATTATATAPGSSSSLRIRQHPSRGPYVEGLTHVRVRDAAQVMRFLNAGLRDRSTAETKMNEHSSRSHAIMQIHVTKVTVIPDETSVTTKTRTCKVNMVDLAGSERVTQSGATGDRLEEAKNINLSLSTLGRVIQQLSEKQAGKNVVPSYRDSVLTWLLSDSLGGNSKTIMLATIAPSAYCYHQTLNTLRFAGVAKKVINVATVNEDQHIQQLVTELRQQIVRLTLQLESGKASQVHIEEIRQLREENERLLSQNDALRVQTANMMDAADAQALRRRNTELEDMNQQLDQEKVQLQQRLLASSSALREDLAHKRQELLALQAQLDNKDTELAAASSTSAQAHTEGNNQNTSPGSASADGLRPSESAALTNAQAEIRKLQVQLAREKDENVSQKKKVQNAEREVACMKQSQQDAIDSATAARQGREEYQKRWTESQQLADNLQKRLDTTLDLLERAQTDLTVLRSDSVTEAAKARAVESARENLLASQLEQTRQDYLNEKQANVQMLLRVSQVEQDRSQLKKQEAAMHADVHELEQLLLEETENSERHYTRMRYHRSLNEVLHYMVRTLQHELGVASGQVASAAATRRTSYGTTVGGLSPQASFAFGSSVSASPRGAAVREDPSSPKSPFFHALGTTGVPAHAVDALAASLSVQNAAFTNELYYAQLEYELLCEESHQRGLLVQEYLVSSNRLWSHRARLSEVQAGHAAEQYNEALDRLQILQEELAHDKKKVSQMEEAAREAKAAHIAASDAMRTNELARLTLTRQLRAAEEAKADAEREVEMLVEHLAAAETIRDELELRLRAYESTVADGTDEASGGSVIGGRGGVGDPQPPPSSHRLINEERVAALSAQCDAYREELGLLRAQQERQAAGKGTQEEANARDMKALELEVMRMGEAKQKLAEELEATARDHNQRVAQQQRMIDTLRTALEEETKMADLCRTASQQAEAARHGAEESLAAARASCDVLTAEKVALEARYQALELDVTELRQHYVGMERQLVELQAREPELYLLLEKGAAEDNVAWIGKARQERAILQKQKLEARRMNSELLQHVRQRTTHLRDVQRQLWDIPSSTPTASPSALSTAHSSASTPLGNSTRGLPAEPGAQRQLDLDQKSLVSPSSMGQSATTSPTSKDKMKSLRD